MSPLDRRSLRETLAFAAPLDGRMVYGGSHDVELDTILRGSCLGGHAASLASRSVLIATADQLAAALALIELDGQALRLTLCPPDLRNEHLASVIRDAAVEAIVCSDPSQFAGLGVARIVTCGLPLLPDSAAIAPRHHTEWLMLTSGTTGAPKIAVHTLKGLTGAIKPGLPPADKPVWGTFYDIRRYGGLQIFLRAILGSGSLVLSRPGEAIAEHLHRLADCGVSHMTGTPTHWRRALLSSAATAISPRYIRLSGEIADQAVLDALKTAYPAAAIGHAYASTEAGVGFEVNDGREGFPAAYLGPAKGDVEMKIEEGSLRLRSARMASYYAGRPDLRLIGADGFVDTGDMVELRGERCYFAGRRDGVINVGGLKVHPEEIEAVINRHAMVRLSRVKSRKSPIIGAIVVADVVLAGGLAATGHAQVKAELMELCRAALPAHKIPAVINVIAAIETTAGGKLSRHYA